MNIRKKISALTAAVMCFSAMSAFSPAVSAEDDITLVSEYSAKTLGAEDGTLYDQIRSMVGMSYSSNLAKQVKKYNKEKASTVVKYSKSRTGKLCKKLEKAIKDKKGFSLGTIDSSAISEVAVKGDNIRFTFFGGENTCMILYVDKKNLSVCVPDPDYKYKVVYPIDTPESLKSASSLFDLEDGGFEITNIGDVSDVLGSEFDKNSKFKVFKFEYKNKNYVYERLDDKKGKVSCGFLYDDKGDLVMVYDGATKTCSGIKISFSVPDSAFVISDDYLDLSSMPAFSNLMK